jgi:hypothetical protein
VELVLDVAVTIIGYVAALFTVWVQERQRQARLVKVALQLPYGSRCIECGEGVVIEIGSPPADEPSAGQGQHERNCR